MSEAAPSDPSPEDERLGATPAEQVIALFGGIRPMAAKLAVPVTTVQGWKKRGQIPPNRHESITTAAASLGLALEPNLLAQAGLDRESPGPAPVVSSELAASAELTAEKAPLPIASPPNEEKSEPPPRREAVSPSSEKISTTSPPPRPRRGSGLGIAALVLALIAVAAALTQPFWSPRLLHALDISPPQRVANESAAIAALQNELTDVRAALEAAQRTPADTTSVPAITELTQRLAVLESRPVVTAADSEPDPALTERLTAMEERLSALTGRLQETTSEIPARLSAQRETLAQLSQQLLQTRVELQSLRREVQGNSLPQLQAQARTLILLQLRSALQTSTLFTAELQAAVQQAESDPALQERLSPVFATLEAIAPRGALTAPQLAAELPALSRDAAQQSRLRPDAGFWDRVMARLASVVSIRTAPSETAAGDTLPAALARAEAALQRDDLPAAIAALAAQQDLPEPVSTWLTAAQARQTVDEAQTLIGQAVAQSLPRRTADPVPPALPPSPTAVSPEPTPAIPSPAAEPPPPAPLELPPMIGTPE